MTTRLYKAIQGYTVFMLGALVGAVVTTALTGSPREMVSPMADTHSPLLPQEIAVADFVEEEEGRPHVLGTWVGTASYYSRAGCLGCSENLIMANGEPLDDTRLTVAFNKAPLGTMLDICNVETQDCVRAEVTDRGGFERLGRIIDLSVATKNALNCGGLCEVEITALKY